MEDGLGEMEDNLKEALIQGLNPCFSGGWSRRAKYCAKYGLLLRLNPCFSGGWSRSIGYKPSTIGKLVLILVLVEDGLGAS